MTFGTTCFSTTKAQKLNNTKFYMTIKYTAVIS